MSEGADWGWSALNETSELAKRVKALEERVKRLENVCVSTEDGIVRAFHSFVQDDETGNYICSHCGSGK